MAAGSVTQARGRGEWIPWKPLGELKRENFPIIEIHLTAPRSFVLRQASGHVYDQNSPRRFFSGIEKSDVISIKRS